MLPKVLSPVSPSKSNFSLLRVAAAILSCALTSSVPMLSQTPDAAHAGPNSPVPTRLTAPIVESSRVPLLGSVHPLANAANDRGAISASTKLDRLQIVLKRSPAQEASLKRLITDLHSPGTASYHKWLTPDQFGKQFGPSDADVAALQSWLQAKGFSITKLTPGRQVLEISGTAGQLQNTFHTQMHQYSVAGVTRYANASAPDIPEALAPVFGGFVSLNNFRFKSHSRLLGKAQFNPTTHESKPEWTIGNSSNYNLVFAPGDFAVQYDLNPVYAAGTKGDGQAIAIVNESNINIANVNNYRSLFGLPANPPQVIIDGSDPGVDGINSPYGPNFAAVEAYLDVELAGSAAPNAQIDLVIANDTAVDNGLTLAMEHAVYANVAPVISLSFGGCEVNQGSFNTFITGLWEQAAAQGQTVLVSTGDNGSAGCDNDNILQYAVQGQAVNGLASTPYNVAVGGTDFYYSGGASSVGNYWNLTPSNTAATVSLLKPAPEQPWNDSQYGLNLFSTYDTDGTTSIAAGSGGASTLGVTDSNGTPTSPHPKPSWQTGTGVPADGARDLPDVSLFAANGENNSYYPLCAVDADCQPAASGQIIQISGVGGTSASTPAFAGMMALINQKYGRQGQAGYVLYPLAAQFPATFHDVTVGTNSVPCAVSTTSRGVAPKQCKAVSSPISVDDETNGTATEGEISVDGTSAAYNAGIGYDLASGLGTVDANNLVTNWGKITLAASATTLTPSSTSFAHGTPITISGTVTGSPAPTGDVSLLTTSPDINNQGEDLFTLSSGAYSGSISYLPGGSYNIYGYYAGNGTVGPSTSTPVAITVSQETSATVLGVYNSLSSKTPIASGSSVQYGAATILNAIPGSTDSTKTTTAATGSVTFLDGTNSINTAPLNANGYAQYNGPFAIGSHTITAKYSGDGSYSASTSSATSFTVAKNTPAILQTYTNQDGNNNPVNGQVTYLTLQVENSASSNGLALAPTGTITVTGAPTGTNTSATLVPGVDPFNNAPQGTAIFAIPATASGNYTLTFNYAGDTNYAATSAQPTPYTFDTGGGTSATTTTATVSAPATSPTSLVTLTATVTGAGSTRPTGTVYLVASDYLIGQATLPTGTGNSASLTFRFDSAALFQGTNQITVQYIPNSASFGSSATTVTIANPLSDFALVPSSTIVSVPATGSTAGTQTDVISLSSTNGFAGAVSLTCSATGGVTCAISPTAATLVSGGQTAATLTVNTTGVTAAGNYNVLVTGKNTAGTVIHTLGLTVVTPLISSTPSFSLAGTAISTVAGSSGTSTITATPAGGFTGNIAFTCAVTSSPSGAAGTPTCSVSPAMASVTGTAAATSTLTVATSATTTAGSYVVTVTGTSGSLTATTPVAVTVTGVASPSFSLTGTAPAAIAAPGDSTTSTITVTPASGFIGAVALTCAVTTPPTGAVAANDPTCSAASASVSSASPATATLTINTTSATTAGAYTLTVTGTSGSTTASTTITVNVTAAAAPSFTLTGTAVTIASQGATGTSTITVTPANAFTGTVNLTCAVASAPTGATTADNPTCSASSASVTSASAATATLTINTTAQSAKLELPFTNSNEKGIFTAGGGAALAAILLLCVPFGRRRSKQLKSLRGVRILSLAILFALAAGAAIGCGGGSSTPPPAGGGTTTGAYTLTVTGTSGSTTASTTITVTVN
jgi:subtilase family serine protease